MNGGCTDAATARDIKTGSGWSHGRVATGRVATVESDSWQGGHCTYVQLRRPATVHLKISERRIARSRSRGLMKRSYVDTGMFGRSEDMWCLYWTGYWRVQERGVGMNEELYERAGGDADEEG